MISPLYKGSVKDLRGPVSAAGTPALIFEYTDAYSVFDWGRMPDPLAGKGQALAVLAADWFERLESPEQWKEFSKSPAALSLRKGNRFGAAFNELGERLQARGLRTHFLGTLPALPEKTDVTPVPIAQAARANAPFRHLVVRQVSVVKPDNATVLGRSIPDYSKTRISPPPRLVPLEVVFRFSCPEGSSLLERVARDPNYLASIGFGKAGGFAEYSVTPGARWDFPVLELFTKLESSDRPLNLTEALAISGLEGAQLQDLLLKTAWVAGFIKALCAKSGVELADGKLEWGVDAQGETFLVDAIGPDELRLLKDGIQLSKEFLRGFYRDSSWYAAIGRAKEQAKAQGVADWKRLAGETPAPLSQAYRELGSQVYLALANELTGRKWFTEAWSIEKVVEGIRALKSVSRSSERPGG